MTTERPATPDLATRPYVVPADALTDEQQLAANARKRQARLPENSQVAALMDTDPAVVAADKALRERDEPIDALYHLQDRIGKWDGVLGVGDDDEQLSALAEDARLLARLCDWIVACNRLELQAIQADGKAAQS